MTSLDPSPTAHVVTPRNLVRRFLDKMASRVPIRIQQVALGILFVPWLVFAAGRVFEATPFGLDPRKPYAVVTLIGMIYLLIFGPGLWSNALARQEEKRLRDEEYERKYIRDPEEEARLRRHIGMPPNNRMERPREP